MEEVNILVIGAGVIGLSIGKVLAESHDEVVVVEQESSFGRHTSSRNSEVIHSGIYYPQNTLKAILCVQGVSFLYQYCQEHHVPFSNCGKLVVANSETEKQHLCELKQNGEKNGVKDLEILDKEECLALEPQIKALAALKVNATGILDTHKFMASLEREIDNNDGFVVYEMEASNIESIPEGYIVTFSNGEKYRCKILINCAGLFCERIAHLAGIDTTSQNLKIHFCKGEYFKTSKIRDIKRLIYPLPDPTGISLGIHLSINLLGDIRFGPNAYYINEIDYKMDETHLKDFHKAVTRYLDLEEDWLMLDDCGIRPKLQAPGESFRDFYIREESPKGLPGFINLMGIESPGLTACLAIANYVKQIIAKL